MRIEPIIYDTTRGVFNVEDKLSIATVFLFAWQYGEEDFAELLYTDDPDAYIKGLNDRFKQFDVDFTVRLDDRNVREAFDKTRIAVRDKHDADGFYKALYNRDEFAIAVLDIVSVFCNECPMDAVKEMRKTMRGQLTLF